MPKLAWVLIPLAAYAAVLAILAWRGRPPARLALNVHTSLLLLAYLLTTAGLGIFWVANQQLPVFDWHYLFGYATLALVSVHLVFNLPIVVRWFARKQPKPAALQRGGPRLVLQAAGLAAAFGIAYFVGTRQAGDALPAAVPGDMPASVQAVVQYHAFSSASRGRVFKRAPGVEWGSAPPPFKRYAGAGTIALERGAAGGASLGDMLRTPGSARRLDLARLGEMMYLSAGITQQRGGHALRAAPSSGALFPSELYVVARSVEGLAPGLYHYDPEHHRLDVLGPLPATIGSAAADRADAAIVLSAVFRRTGYKYHNRAYRYAAADAGHLLENVRLGAHRAGVRAQLLAAFDDAAAERAIEADGVEEGVLAVVTLNGPPVPGPSAAERQRFAPVSDPRASAIGVTGLVQRATSLRRDERGEGEIVALPAPEPFTRDLHETIVNRRSERRFGADAMPLADLSSLLAGAAQPAQLSDAVTLNIVVNRVDGLPRGVYRYLPRHALQRVRSGDYQAAAQSAALSQDVIGDAAAVLVLSADRDAVLAQGARGYRHVLIEAGLVGERWLLGATARGLAACPVGAFYDDEAAALIGADPHRQWVLHFAAVGTRAP